MAALVLTFTLAVACDIPLEKVEAGETPEGTENPGGENPDSNPSGTPGGEKPGDNPGGTPGGNPIGENPGDNPSGETPPGDEITPPVDDGILGGNFTYGDNNVVVNVNPDNNTADISINNYVPVPPPTRYESGAIMSRVEFEIPEGIRADLDGLDVSVTIENDGLDTTRPSPGTLSLSVVHEIYQAAKAAGAASVSVKSPAPGTLLPLYRGSDWLKEGFASLDPSTSDYINFYEKYDDGDELMPGFTIRKVDGKYALEYDRNLVVEDIVYDNPEGHNIYGAGLYKKEGSGAVLIPSTENWADVVIGSDSGVRTGVGLDGGRGDAPEPAEYLKHLRDAGLLYTGGDTPSPTHNMHIGPSQTFANNNMFYNGLYDFFQAHVKGNIKECLTGFGGYLDGSVFENGDQVYDYTTGEYVVKGLGPGLSPPNRRGDDGTYNPAFPGNIPVSMVNALHARGIKDLSNVNIIGDGEDLISTTGLTLANVSLVNNGTPRITGLEGKFYGLIDIEGDVPAGIENGTDSSFAYLTIWNASESTTINRFAVVHVKNATAAVVERIGAGNGGYASYFMPPDAIVLESKAAVDALNANSRYADTSWTPYKAVRASDGSYKFTGGTGDGFDANYASNTSQPVPSLDPEEWRQAGNDKKNPETKAWASLDSDKKWTVSDFAGISMLRDAAARLADAVLPHIKGRGRG
jgi:hypothetical protein